jgi:integrase
MPPLSDTRVRRAKPQPKPYKLYDEDGLYLLVHPRGAKYWRFKYKMHGHEKLLALGVYDDVSLKLARERRDDARKLVADFKDPAAAKRAAKVAAADTFKAVATEWLAKQHLAAKTRSKAEWIFNDLLFPTLGDKPLRTIETPDVLAALRKIEAKGHHETARRAKQRACQVFSYAIATGRADRDPTAGLRGALTAPKVTHRAAVIEPKKIGELLRAIDGCTGQPSTRYALKLAPLLFVRPGELRAAEWSEFDLDAAEWRIPGERMKMKQAHLVPLSTQAVALLKELQPINCGRLLFPGLGNPGKPISDAAMNVALRRIGYDGSTMTSHGFRSVASSLLNELGWAPDLIELQLAHRPRDQVRAAYNRAERLPERRKLMQAWADHLDQLRAGNSNVVPIRQQA